MTEPSPVPQRPESEPSPKHPESEPSPKHPESEPSPKHPESQPQAAAPPAKGHPWHSAGWWAGLGGIVTAVSAVIALLAWLFPRQPAEPATPSKSAAAMAGASAPPFTVNVAVNQANCAGATAFHLVPASQAGKVRKRQNSITAVPIEGAADAVYSDVMVSLQGTSNMATILQEARVRVVRRDKPAGVVYQDNVNQCGGITPAFFGIDLDQPDPKAKPLPGDDGKARPFPFKISESDPEVFHIYGVTRSCDCRWYVEIVWLSNGVRGVTTIDEQGAPFRTVGTDGLPVFLANEDDTWTLGTSPPWSPMD